MTFAATAQALQPSFHKLPTHATPTRTLSLVQNPSTSPAHVEPAPPSGPRRAATRPVTLVEFSCQVTVSDPQAFRYRWTLIHARRAVHALWTDQEVVAGAVRVAEKWHLLFPEAASAILEVEGGTAGPVRAVRVSSRQEPLGNTFAVDAI